MPNDLDPVDEAFATGFGCLFIVLPVLLIAYAGATEVVRWLF